MIASLLDFVTAIERLGMNPLAQSMFRRLVKPDNGLSQSAIVKTQEEFYKTLFGIPERPFATSFFEWTAIMRNRLYLLQKMDPLKLAKERNLFLTCLHKEEYFENVGDINAEQSIPKYSQDILGLGYYLDFYIYNDDSNSIVSRTFAHSGAAFICDLAMMYPSNDEFKSILKEMFPSHKNCENELGFTFSPENAFPLGFIDSAKNIENFVGVILEGALSPQNTKIPGRPAGLEGI